MTGFAAAATERSALAHEVSCRFLTPLLDLAEAEKLDAGLDQLLGRWELERAELRDESNWVSLRFCEDLCDWLAGRVGAEALAERVTRATFSPRALGVLYPVMRAFGSPRVGYGALPQLVARMTKVSTVTVSGVRRGSAEIVYRPSQPAHKARSPLICFLRKAQIAAGPTLWKLPAARVEEAECQSRGGECSARHANEHPGGRLKPDNSAQKRGAGRNERHWLRASCRGRSTGARCRTRLVELPPPYRQLTFQCGLCRERLRGRAARGLIPNPREASPVASARRTSRSVGRPRCFTNHERGTLRFR